MIEISSGLNINLREIIENYRKNRNIEVPDEVKKLYNKNTQFTETELNDFKLVIGKNKYYLKHFDKMIEFDKNKLKTRKDLFWVKNIKIINSENFINSDMFEVLSNLPNIENLEINKACLDKQSIQMIIESYPNLKSLSIWEQPNIDSINLKNNKQLEEVCLSSNMLLTNVYGLNELEKLSWFDFYNNPSYIKIDEICEDTLKILENGGNVYLDTLYFPKISEMLENNIGTQGLHFVETVSYNTDLSNQYNFSIMSHLDKKAKSIIDKYIFIKDSNLEKYAIIYQWLCENITYNYDYVNNDCKNDKGYSYGPNGLESGFIQKNAVCEGYTKMAQYLLNLCDIKSINVVCGIKEPIDHSIIQVGFSDLGNSYYSDITWDSSRYHKGEERKYFLLSRNDISKDHKLYNFYDVNTYNESLSKEETDKLINFAQERIKSVNVLTDKIEEMMNVDLDMLDEYGFTLLIRDIRKKLTTEIDQSLKHKMIGYLEQRQKNIYKRLNEKENSEVERRIR